MSEILVIEDDNDLREIAVKMLTLAGYSAIGTGTRDEAIELISNDKEINTLLVDISMPGISLDQFFSRIEDKIEQMHIIISSGQTDELVEDFLRTYDSFRFLAKPYGFSELRAVLQSM